ncbi:MAG: hypothetical protein Q8O62_09915 [Aequorivita sp.]|nr:hypothetical protein [Aequorivita sp.]
MYKVKHAQRTLSLVAGDSQKEVDFSDIYGPIMGYATKPIGTIPAGQSADLAIYDGATEVLAPIDISVGDVTNKNSFVNGIVTPLTVEYPGRIKAQITPSAVLAGAEAYKVKVIIFYAIERSATAAGNTPNINDCL